MPKSIVLPKAELAKFLKEIELHTGVKADEVIKNYFTKDDQGDTSTLKYVGKYQNEDGNEITLKGVFEEKRLAQINELEQAKKDAQTGILKQFAEKTGFELTDEHTDIEEVYDLALAAYLEANKPANKFEDISLEQLKEHALFQQALIDYGAEAKIDKDLLAERDARIQELENGRKLFETNYALQYGYKKDFFNQMLAYAKDNNYIGLDQEGTMSKLLFNNKYGDLEFISKDGKTVPVLADQEANMRFIASGFDTDKLFELAFEGCTQQTSLKKLPSAGDLGSQVPDASNVNDILNNPNATEGEKNQAVFDEITNSLN